MLKIKVVHDEDMENPRKAWDHGTEIIINDQCRYSFGDRTASDEEIDELIREGATPLYMYDHSGITISTSPFGCRWDSGMVGCVVVKEQTDNPKALIEAEVTELDMYLQGEVYGVVIYREEECPHCGKIEEDVIDSCWGILGYDAACEEAVAACQHMKEAFTFA